MRYDWPVYTDLHFPLLRALASRGGSILFSIEGEEIEEILADEFQLAPELREYSSPEITSKGGRKWRNMIQFARRRLVDSGYMGKSVRDLWIVTDRGYGVLGIDPPKRR